MSEGGSDQLLEKSTSKPTPEANKILVVGDKEIKIGDFVFVKRTNGELESGWSLKSFGTKYVVVEKPANEQGDLLRKRVSIDEFKQLQASQQPENQDIVGGSESKDPRLFIDMWRNKFIKSEKVGTVDRVNEGMVKNFRWQQVRYGAGVKGRNDQLYRGYLMVETQRIRI